MKKFLFLFFTFWLSGCSLFSYCPDGFQETYIETEYFTFPVLEKSTLQKGQNIHIYIEGDGNPNPSKKIALYYAKQDPSENVIYVPRPCQNSKDKICKTKPEIYQGQRFHPEILREMQELITYLIHKHKAKSIDLIGYDGGGLIAMEVASHIQTNRVITIAGILDVAAYTNYNNLPPMEDAVNPAGKISALSDIEQIHYVGTEDEITPPRVAEHFVAKMNNPKSAVVKRVKGVGHSNWKGILLDF